MKIQKIWKKEIIIVVGAMFFGIFFLLIDHLGVLNFLRSGISFSMEPVALAGSRIGEGSRSYFDNFVNLKELVLERNNLKVLLQEKEIENGSYIELLSENEVLKKQLKVGDREGKYILASILADSSIDHLRIDKGVRDEISIGDTVEVGNFYVGTIDSVDEFGARVKLPSSNSSFLSVVIVKTDEQGTYVKSKVVSKGVINGSSQGIKVENISMNTDVQNGDVILVNDPYVRDMLILGYVVGLSNDPANISRNCFVSLLQEYDSLVKVMVRID